MLSNCKNLTASVKVRHMSLIDASYGYRQRYSWKFSHHFCELRV